MRGPSIRRSLLVRCGLGIGALLCLLSGAVYLMVQHSLYRELDGSLYEAMDLLTHQLELENGGITHEWRESIDRDQPAFRGVVFEFWDEKSGEPARSPGLRDYDLPRFCGPNGGFELRTVILPNGNVGRALGQRILPFVAPDELERMKEKKEILDPKSYPHILVVARDASPVRRTLMRMRWIFAGGTVFTAAIGFLLVNWAIRSALHPLEFLTRHVRERSEQQLDSALPVPGSLPSELRDLARNFDSLLGRVAVIRQRERDFIRHAAHELRTPIAGLRATTDLALSQDRSAEAYAGHLKACHRSAVELGELVQRLTALARIESTPAPTVLMPVDIGSLLAESVERFRNVATARGLGIHMPEPGQIPMAKADPTLLRIVFTNLLDNATTYSADGGQIVISTRVDEQHLEITFSNPVTQLPEDPERLFEPLFRHDDSRHDASSHLGIGLTLSRDAAVAMNGTLKACQATPPDRIEFALSLPI